MDIEDRLHEYEPLFNEYTINKILYHQDREIVIQASLNDDEPTYRIKIYTIYKRDISDDLSDEEFEEKNQEFINRILKEDSDHPIDAETYVVEDDQHNIQGMDICFLYKNLEESDLSIDEIPIDRLYDLGIKKFDLGDYSKAKDYFEKGLKYKESDCISGLGFLYENGYGVERDLNKAYEYYQMSAKLDNPAGATNLAYFLENGLGCEVDYQKAVEYYQQAIKHNFVRAYCEMGRMYLLGRGVNVNLEKAFECFLPAATAGHAGALFYLGTFYEEGQVVDQDYTKAFECYQEASNQGNEIAQFYLSRLYQVGDGCNQNNEKAKYWLNKSIQQGYVPAITALAFNYEYGELTGLDFVQDLDKARELYLQAARLEYAPAQYNLGRFYQEHNRYSHSAARGNYWLKKAVKQGYVEAYVALAYNYEIGNGLKTDTKRAFNYYLEAAKYNSSSALCNLAYCYDNGIGTDRNFALAKEYYEKAVELNNPRAMCNLATIYMHDQRDDGHEQDMVESLYERAIKMDYLPAYYGLAIFYLINKVNEEKAVKLLEVACDNDYPEAFNALGEYYHDRDPKKSLTYYQQAIEHGESFANIHCGVLLKEGKGMAKDYKRAFEYFLEAAKYQYPEAYFEMGAAYLFGEGVEKDVGKAVECLLSSLDIKQDGASYYLLAQIFSNDPDYYNIDKAIEYANKALEYGDGDKEFVEQLEGIKKNEF